MQGSMEEKQVETGEEVRKKSTNELCKKNYARKVNSNQLDSMQVKKRRQLQKKQCKYNKKQ